MRTLIASIFLPLLLIILPAAASCADVAATRETLRGIPGLAIGLDLQVNDQPGDPALTALLLKDIELKLRMGGVPILSPEQAVSLPGMPQLQVSIIMRSADGGRGHVFAVFIEVLQRVSLVQNPDIRNILAPTWSSVYALGTADATETAGDSLQEIRSILKQELVTFTDAYRSVNAPAQLL